MQKYDNLKLLASIVEFEHDRNGTKSHGSMRSNEHETDKRGKCETFRGKMGKLESLPWNFSLLPHYMSQKSGFGEELRCQKDSF